MKPFVSRSLRISFVSTLLASLALIASAMDSAAQGKPNLARLIRRSGERASQVRQTQPSSPSTPTWSLPDPFFDDPDLFTDRESHSAVYDPGTNSMIVFGGADTNLILQNDVLVDSNANGSGGFEAGSWSELNLNYPVPPPRISHSAVYDQTNNRMIVFGGCADIYCFLPLNDTWVLSSANGSGGTPAWTQLSPTGTPPSPRYDHDAVYDATNNRMIVYSGEGADFVGLSDVWVLSNANGLGGTPAWTQLSPSGGPPDAMDGSTGVYDPATNRMIVFGGYPFVNSVWTLSNANGLGGTPAWTNLIANGKAGSPPVRFGAQATYDSTSNRMTIYGGSGDAGLTNPDFDFQALGDVWVLTNANGSGGSPVWAQLHPKWEGDGNIQPGARFYHTAVRDPLTNSMIVFGGETVESVYFQPWVLSNANGL